MRARGSRGAGQSTASRRVICRAVRSPRPPAAAGDQAQRSRLRAARGLAGHASTHPPQQGSAPSLYSKVSLLFSYPRPGAGGGRGANGRTDDRTTTATFHSRTDEPQTSARALEVVGRAQDTL